MLKNYQTNGRQRALVLQGGGALGSYDVGVYEALYKKISEIDEKNGEKDRPTFDIVAGTSSGAMNAAILVSHVVKEGTWEGSVQVLKSFWKHVKTQSVTDLTPGFKCWWKYFNYFNPFAAKDEVARRYYSVKGFLCSGVPNVYLPEFSTPCLPFNGLPTVDYRFLDNFGVPTNNTWYIYTNRPLKESLKNFVKCPIATRYNKNQYQPRLLLVSLDVEEGVSVTFDSYPKDKQNTTRYSKYGVLIKDEDNKMAKHSFKTNNKDDDLYKYTINYPDGIILDYVMASGSVPINYPYAKIYDVEEKKPQKDNNNNISIIKKPRCFWDGGISSNTPLRELIQAHKDYWFEVEGRGTDNSLPVPDLDVYIIDVWPTTAHSLPIDYDAVKGRYEDLLLNDKTDYDEKTANIVSDYINLVKMIMSKYNIKNLDKEILLSPIKSTHRNGDPRTNKDLLEGRFDINVNRIERTSNIDLDISNKMLDYSKDTINNLMEDGYNDTMKFFEKHHDEFLT